MFYMTLDSVEVFALDWPADLSSSEADEPA